MTKKYLDVVTRRDFIRGTAYAGIGAAIGVKLGMERKPGKKARVILIRDENVFKKNGQINGDVIQQMLDRAIAAFLGENDAIKAWKQLVKPTETVGIKSNVWATPNACGTGRGDQKCPRAGLWPP